MSPNSKLLWIAVASSILVGTLTTYVKSSRPEAAPQATRILAGQVATSSVPRRADAVVPDTELGVKSRSERKAPLLAESKLDTLRAGTVLFGDSTHFARITAVLEKGRNLIVTDSRTSPHVFIFEKASGRLVKTMGRQGEGPGEIIYPDNVIDDERDPNLVWIYDFNLRRLVGLDVRGEKVEKPLNVSLPAGGSLLQPMLRDGLVVSNGLFTGYSLLFLDSEGKPKGKSDLIAPFGPPEVPNRIGQRLLNVSTMAFSPKSRSKIVLAYQFKSELDILDLSTGHHITVTGPRPVKASFHFDDKGAFFWNADNQMAYLGVTADENRIYALFSGHKDDDKSEYTTSVHIFDWNGQFLAEYAFDRMVDTIAASLSGAELYGSVEEPWPAVATFRIPTLTAPRR
jgi:hypothetical protein